jgi:hypothetical protein
MPCSHLHAFFVDTNVVVSAFTTNKHLVRFDLGPKVLEGNRTLCREGDSTMTMIPTIHGTFFRGLTVIVLLVPIHDRHSRAVNCTEEPTKKCCLIALWQNQPCGNCLISSCLPSRDRNSNEGHHLLNAYTLTSHCLNSDDDIWETDGARMPPCKD